ncbi:histone-like nucleoid-structuring protein Lsr2 [Streptomyces sp. NPDC058426]|uniref:Lsr2 family DNA-binding protein n=1 Tax=Streptomyces sp. NPDC058426 TaxID=3346493 RepID=UPI00364AEFE0
MYDDLNPAQTAERLELTPPAPETEQAAARAVAQRAHGKEDLTLLLDALGLPHNDDTLTELFPLIPETGATAPMTHNIPAPAPAVDASPAPAGRSVSAFEAMALSMHSNGDSIQGICAATGLSETELSYLLAAPATGTPAVALAVTPEIQELLDWAAAHPAASVRARAARITADLAELSERRDSEAAQREAEEKVARAKAELEKAQEELRAAKAGARTTTAAATAPTPIRVGQGSGRTREELAAVRAWARENGHQVADAGMVPKRVLQAYDAAHRAPVRKAG